MGFKCNNCKGDYKDGPDGTLVHSCKDTGMNYRVTRDGGIVAGHNHPTSFLIRDKSTSATKPDTAASKKPKKDKKH